VQNVIAEKVKTHLTREWKVVQ